MHKGKMAIQRTCMGWRIWPRGTLWNAVPCTEEGKSPSVSSFGTSDSKITAVNWGEFSKSLPSWSEAEAVALWGEPEWAELDQPGEERALGEPDSQHLQEDKEEDGTRLFTVVVEWETEGIS